MSVRGGGGAREIHIISGPRMLLRTPLRPGRSSVGSRSVPGSPVSGQAVVHRRGKLVRGDVHGNALAAAPGPAGEVKVQGSRLVWYRQPWHDRQSRSGLERRAGLGTAWDRTSYM